MNINNVPQVSASPPQEVRVDAVQNVGNAPVQPGYSSGQSSDRIEISSQGAYATNLASSLRKMDTVRPNVVGELKDQVEVGMYPPPALINGLNRLLGNIPGAIVSAKPPEEA